MFSALTRCCIVLIKRPPGGPYPLDSFLPMSRTYQLMVQIGGVGEIVPTTWPPRSLRAASALCHYYARTWPSNSYWLRVIDPGY